MGPFLTLSRYFVRTFLTWLSVFTLGIVTVVLLFDFSELLRRSATKPDMTITVVLEMAFLKLPYLLEQLFPFIVLFAAMFSLWRLNRQNEICVARAAGLSAWQFLSPFIIVVSLIGFLGVTVWNPISSSLWGRYRLMNSEYIKNRKDGITISTTGIWLRHAGERGPVVLRIGYINTRERQISDLSILEYNDDDTLRLRIDSKTASFTDNGLNMENVWVYPYRGTPVFHKKGFYQTSLTFKHIQTNNMAPETISFWKLPAYINLLEESGLSSKKYRLYWHAIMARAAWLIAMVLLAATCTLRPLRSGRNYLYIVPAAFMGFSLYFLRDITYAMGQSASLPAVFAAWAPIAISLMLGVLLLLHTEE